MRDVKHLAFVLLLTLISAVSNAQVISTDLRFANGDGAVITPNGAAIGFAALKDIDPHLVAIEAEDASKLTFQDAKTVSPDPQASGGHYIADVTYAEYDLNVKESGQYQGWARIFLPRPGGWNHRESIDMRNPQKINDSARWVFGEWIWSKLGQYDLGKGQHKFVLHGFLGGARIDTLLFSRAIEYPGEALIGLPVGAVETQPSIVSAAPLCPSAIASWTALAWDYMPNGGTVTAEVSVDGGETWTAVGTDADLSMLPVSGNGTDQLLARFALHPATDGRSPILKRARIAFRRAAKSEISVENDFYRIAFSRHTGALCGLRNKVSHVDITPQHIQQPWMSIGVRTPGATEMQTLPQTVMKFTDYSINRNATTLKYSTTDDKIHVQVDLQTDDTEVCRVRQTVQNNSNMEIIRLDFPVIGNAALGECIDDEAVIPRTGGWRIKNPAAEKTWMTTYVGGGSMPWLDLWDTSGGLFMMIEDQRLTTTEMACSPSAGRKGVELSFGTMTLIPPGASKIRDYRIGIHQGDWHWAADTYREWAYTWMKQPDDPEWLKWTDGWCHGNGALKFASVGKMIDRMQAEGWEYLQYWGHMTDGINQCCGNFYWPAPALGGAEAFTRGVKDLHEAGGKVTCYMNCQTWTRDSYKNAHLRLTPKSELPAEALNLIHPLSWFEKNRLLELNGKERGYYADTLGWYIMCPASEGFREHLKFWIVDMYAKRFGVDGIYLDQTGATLAKPCYDLTHGHDDIGDWAMGNVQLLQEALSEARKINPDFVIAIEGCGDALGQYASPHLLSGLCTHPEVYHYTFPEHILISGYANGSPFSKQQRVTRAHLNGDRFDAFVGDELMNKALQLRQRIKRWLYPARFMDTVGLSTSHESILARWNICDKPQQNAIVFTFENSQGIEGESCTLSLPAGWEKPALLYIYDSEGSVMAPEPMIDNGQISFEIPSTLMSAAILMYETTPAHQVDVWHQAALPGDPPDLLRLNAVNYGKTPVVTTISITTEAPLQCSEIELEITIPARGIAHAETQVKGFNRLQKPSKITVNSEWADGDRQNLSQIRPMFLNGDLDIDDDGNDIPDFWSPGGTTSNFPVGIEDGAFWMQGNEKEFQYAIQHVALKPNSEYYFAGRIKRSKQTDKVSIAVVETLAPSGYRIHRLGDDASLPADQWQSFETYFTTGSDFAMTSVYLYIPHTDAKAWFDNIVLLPAEAHQAAHPLVNATLEADKDNNQVPDAWGLGGTRTDFLHGIEDGAFWMQGQPDHLQYAMQTLKLQQNTKYRVAGRIKRSVATEGVSIGFVRFIGEKGLRIFKIGNDPNAPANVWQRFEGEFTTGDDFHRAGVYLYNIHTDAKAWFDDIEITPAE